MDSDTVKDGTITLQNHDSMKQVRASQDEVVSTSVALAEGRKTVEVAFKRLPEFLGKSNEH